MDESFIFSDMITVHLPSRSNACMHGSDSGKYFVKGASSPVADVKILTRWGWGGVGTTILNRQRCKVPIFKARGIQ